MKCVPSVQKYLGITLLPQAGVALGMCIAASSLGEYEGETDPQHRAVRRFDL